LVREGRDFSRLESEPFLSTRLSLPYSLQIRRSLSPRRVPRPKSSQPRPPSPSSRPPRRPPTLSQLPSRLPIFRRRVRFPHLSLILQPTRPPPSLLLRDQRPTSSPCSRNRNRIVFLLQEEDLPRLQRLQSEAPTSLLSHPVHRGAEVHRKEARSTSPNSERPRLPLYQPSDLPSLLLSKNPTALRKLSSERKLSRTTQSPQQKKA